jgi:hypothetical protein
VPIVAFAAAATALPAKQAEELLELCAIYRALPAHEREALLLVGRTLENGDAPPIQALLTSFLRASPEMRAAVVGWLAATVPAPSAARADGCVRRSTGSPRGLAPHQFSGRPPRTGR